jgi:hypothetical protein
MSCILLILSNIGAYFVFVIPDALLSFWWRNPYLKRQPPNFGPEGCIRFLKLKAPKAKCT